MTAVPREKLDRIIQRFEWTWENREIWMDGRKLPNVDDYLPRYNGYSVGKWEGDTLVIDSSNYKPGSFMAELNSRFRMPIASRGILAGATNPNQPPEENPGTVSAMVG